MGIESRFLGEPEHGTPPNLGSLSSPRGGRCPIVAEGKRGVIYVDDGQNKFLIRAVVNIFDPSPSGPDNQY